MVDGAGVAFLAPASVGLVALIGSNFSFFAVIDKTIPMKWDEDSERIRHGGEKNRLCGVWTLGESRSVHVNKLGLTMLTLEPHYAAAPFLIIHLSKF